MELNKTHNTVRNMAWGFVDKVVTILMPFFARTIIIKVLGAEYLGLNGLFASILSVLNIAELGISSAIVFSMYKPLAEGAKDEICALLGLYRRAYRVIGAIIGIGGIIILPFLEFFIEGEIPTDINVYSLYIIYLSNTVLSYFFFSYKACILAAHQRDDVTHKVYMGCNALQYFIQCFVVLTCRNYYGYIIWLPIFTIAKNIIIASYVNKKYPEYMCRGEVSAKTLGDIKRQISGLLIGKINVAIRSSLDSLFISTYIGLVTVGMYSNYFLIVTSVTGIINMISNAMLAGVGNSIVLKSVEKNYNDYRKLTFMSQWLVGLASCCMLCLLQPFVHIWVGPELMFSDAMTVICACYLYVSNIGMIRGVYSRALGLWWQMRGYSTFDIAANFILNLIFVRFWGAYGVVLATVIAITLYGIPWATHILFKEYFGKEKYFYYMKELVVYGMVTVVAGGATYATCVFLPFQSQWLMLMARIVICILVPNVIYMMAYGRSTLYQESIRFVKNTVLSYTRQKDIEW